MEYIVQVENDLKPLKRSMSEGNGQFIVINIDEIDTILKYISSGEYIEFKQTRIRPAWSLFLLDDHFVDCRRVTFAR